MKPNRNRKCELLFEDNGFIVAEDIHIMCWITVKCHISVYLEHYM
jgi:hypothetical protein